MKIKLDKELGGINKDDTSNILEIMSDAINEICVDLSYPNKTFNVKESFDKIKNYVSQYDRLLYANISSYCYHMKSEEIDNFQGNLNSLVEYTYSFNYNNGITSLKAKSGTEDEILLREKTKRIIIKLYDNVNLACAQMHSLSKSEDELRSAVVKEFIPLKEQITKDMSSQLITLVGIFTAIAFLVFGGFSSLSDIFSNIDTKSLPKVLMLISLWGLVLCNGLFIFLSCVEKVTQKSSIKNFFAANDLVQWTNLILITLSLLFGWIYCIDKYDLCGWAILFSKNNQVVISIVGFVLIIALLVSGILFIKKSKKNSI